MPQMIDEKTRRELQSILARLEQPVKLVFFTQEMACESCRQQDQLLRIVAGLSDKLTLEVYDLVKDSGKAREYGITKVPGTAVIGEKDYGIRFYGVTAGYEFSSLVEAILMASRGSSGLGKEIEDILLLIDVPVHLEVMVTLTCPYCPHMVHLAHQMAVANENIRADMVDAAEFPQLVQRYFVQGVPRTIINEIPSFEGALPAFDAIMEILKLVKPHVYDRIDAKMREARGERYATEVDPERVYQSIIVGAGPAALSAAVYAARKNLDLAIIGERVGGQITNTASIDNWLGAPDINGQDLARQFRDHVERYPIAELFDAAVSSITKDDGVFHLKTSNGTTFKARTVIYCAGKEYRRLGVPGENRFIGKGIAFCATCDAPIYRDKSVAVVGGGNSAFSSARDLLPFAREIHIINILDDFQADPVLINEVKSNRHVRLHPGMHVVEFLGREKLQGIRVASVDGSARFDLQVDGVFLEIGLEPNSNPLKNLVTLNENGEVPVGRDQSTEVPGLFAAGDVTDEPVKQIVVAAGAGAKAALAAYDYILKNSISVSA
ncbi:MAG: protein disulfide oxidoreductase [Desulfomonilia bacterium]|jgi:alkyl hydroperoxide reductase subunit F|uniref:Alkyl hydroperoxide reductase subunit F n=1 Tax=anaerobic digester metagenome TaxID=1263854 RepID=A0A485LVD7_9ZZZZ|nr:FAD-dependent oxidoreductase [Pseudomonadota bacterium]HON37958.1 FAD-dependent oxidoreductase [Deltaproteobacteria bacterium]HRS56703.1 FAD-dependent oxidoreductase [Desulfomonilia bacterium]HPD21305.1 FAD-dependent oxidoreductase [Deltaproteobacteria bacterium]HPX19125.1 FAD-dependent oxidoreductase [Deltaproteobacteria bacterium]